MEHLNLIKGEAVPKVTYFSEKAEYSPPIQLYMKRPEEVNLV
ncbi:24555_t:CDS:2 [Gigaspora margarita]|uniref:24555_t:CDS:1 n=1 Tax=Gigaspora margarita TaxID=4874 RepID=A0ABN7UQQ9_GIGMA|nr:24555_t:CDS:2 [Gigaspora margarita]